MLWYIKLAVAGVCFLAGWTVNDWHHDAKLAKALKNERAETQLKLDSLQTKLDTANADRLQLSTELAGERATIKVKYRTITQEVPTYVPTNTDACNYDLDPGLVGLLNAAARGVTGSAGGDDTAAGQLPRTVSEEPADLAGGSQGGSDDSMANGYIVGG